VTLLTLQAELERLDREWQMQQPARRRRHSDKDEDDNPLAALIGLAIPLFVLYMIFGRGELLPTVVVLAIVAAGLVIALRSGALAHLTGTRLSASDYQRRRAELVRQIEASGKAG
jgi:hypothetical protein